MSTIIKDLGAMTLLIALSEDGEIDETIRAMGQVMSSTWLQMDNCDKIKLIEEARSKIPEVTSKLEKSLDNLLARDC